MYHRGTVGVIRRAGCSRGSCRKTPVPRFAERASFYLQRRRETGDTDVCAPRLPMPCRCSTEGFPGGFSSAGESLLIYFIQFYVVHPLWMMCRPLGPVFFYCKGGRTMSAKWTFVHIALCAAWERLVFGKLVAIKKQHRASWCCFRWMGCLSSAAGCR